MALLANYSTSSYTAKQTRRYALPSVFWARDYDVTMDGVTDDTSAVAALFTAAASGGTILFEPGTCLLGSKVSPPSNVRVIALGEVIFKAKSTNSSSPVLLENNTKSNIKIEGFTFDGNLANISGFNNVTLDYFCTDVIWIDCKWQNTKGIAYFQTDSTRCGLVRPRMSNVGTYNRTSLSSGDRKQGCAIDDATGPFVFHGDFSGTGLDQISVTGSTDIRVIGNRCNDNNAGTIYCSTNVGGVIANNFVSNGSGAYQDGGNGIDCIGSSNISVTGNTCIKNGASGILIAPNCANITVTGNVCMNNWKGGTSVHRGGITLDGSSGTMSDILIDGNVCDDDQGASTTQEYAIGVRTGGTFNRIRVTKNNILVGRDSTGAVNTLKIFQSNAIGAQPHPMFFNIADAATMNFAPRGVYGRALCVITNSSTIGDFYLRANAAPVELNSSAWETTDTGTSCALYDDGANYIVLKNKTGLTRTLMVTFEGTSV